MLICMAQDSSMQHMGSLWRLLALGALAFAVTSIALWLFRSHPQVSAQRPVAPQREAAENVLTGVPTSPATTEGTTAATVPAGSEIVGSVQGGIRIAGAKGSQPLALELKHAVGVWQPGKGRLRIALSSDAPDYVGASHMLDAIGADGTVAGEGAPAAMLEFVFLPTAQAFTSDELERGTLLVRDAQGRMLETDIIGTLQWSGSVASPQIGAAAYNTNQIEMKLSGSGYSAGAAPRQQEWDLTLSVPVGLRN
jgi:hypothetical protein